MENNKPKHADFAMYNSNTKRKEGNWLGFEAFISSKNGSLKKFAKTEVWMNYLSNMYE